jgi:hypothetical protein
MTMNAHYIMYPKNHDWSISDVPQSCTDGTALKGDKEIASTWG